MDLFQHLQIGPNVWSRARTLLFMVPMAFLAPESASGEENIGAGALEAVVIRSPQIVESSGLAPSYLDRKLFWTHNDSGATARLYSVDRTGEVRGECELVGASAVDWEDMSSFEIDGQPRLVVGDCGNNSRERDTIHLYFFSEPDPHVKTRVDAWNRLSIRFAEGPLDCEAIAVDASRRKVLLLSKSTLPFAGYYEVELPKLGPAAARSHSVVLERKRTVALSMATAMDVDPVSGDVWICNYFGAFQFPCADRNQPLVDQLAGVPKFHELPRWRQIEALAVDHDQHVWLTTEGSPAKLGKLVQRERKKDHDD